MEDKQIVDLFWERSQEAVSESQKKYGRYCHTISYRILHSDEDAEECVNDTYVRAWNAIPPAKPCHLAAFLGKITRNISLDRYEKSHAKKRGSGQVFLALEELQECLPAVGQNRDIADDLALRDALNRFLRSLPVKTRKIFLCRYWYFSTIKEISADCGVGESRVKMTLLRTRNRLKDYLEKEGIEI